MMEILVFLREMMESEGFCDLSDDVILAVESNFIRLLSLIEVEDD
jgi:hypothetical protein